MMSKRRFEAILNEFDEVEYIMDKKLCEDKDFAEFMDFVEELAKENEQLKKEYKIAIDEMVTDYKKLEKENEQLILAIDDLLTHTSCEEVKKENSDLRQNIKIIKDLLSECDLFSDKATEHDIIAYRELHKFDNKDAYSIACAIAKIKKVIDDE